MKRRDVRYKNAAKEAPNFSDEFLVECPKCQGCALLSPMGDTDDDVSSERSLTDKSMNPRYLNCSKCSFQRAWQPGDLDFLRTLVNWFGELPLYLRALCGEQTIWALNAAHLTFLEDQLQQVNDGAEVPPLLSGWLEDVDPASLAESLALLRQSLPVQETSSAS